MVIAAMIGLLFVSTVAFGQALRFRDSEPREALAWAIVSVFVSIAVVTLVRMV